MKPPHDRSDATTAAPANLATTTDALPRFLRSIAEHVDVALVEEVHVFAPIRQGGKESGVAVIAVRQPAPLPEGGSAPDAPDDSWLSTDPPRTEDASGEMHPAADDDAESPYRDDEPPAAALDPPFAARSRASRPRLTVWRASYRWTLKGADRGKWEVDVVAEADAPMLAIDEVVRGVSKRANESSDAERMTGEQFRAALASAAES
ncbi:MAG: hypothetical protein ABJD07_17355 [Gemmatimonadaceae bacterium]